MHNSGQTFVGGYIDHERKAQLVEIARRDDRSQSSVIRRALDSYLTRELDAAASTREARQAITG